MHQLFIASKGFYCGELKEEEEKGREGGTKARETDGTERRAKRTRREKRKSEKKGRGPFSQVGNLAREEDGVSLHLHSSYYSAPLESVNNNKVQKEKEEDGVLFKQQQRATDPTVSIGERRTKPAAVALLLEWEEE